MVGMMLGSWLDLVEGKENNGVWRLRDRHRLGQARRGMQRMSNPLG